MSKETWLLAYERAEERLPENATEEEKVELASKLESDIEARKIDETMDRLKYET